MNFVPGRGKWTPAPASSVYHSNSFETLWMTWIGLGPTYFNGLAWPGLACSCQLWMWGRGWKIQNYDDDDHHVHDVDMHVDVNVNVWVMNTMVNTLALKSLGGFVKNIVIWKTKYICCLRVALFIVVANVASVFWKLKIFEKKKHNLLEFKYLWSAVKTKKKKNKTRNLKVSDGFADKYMISTLPYDCSNCWSFMLGGSTRVDQYRPDRIWTKFD